MGSSSRGPIRGILSDAERTIRRRKYPCLFPTCSANAIKSHSQQRGRALKAIACKGKVIGVNPQWTNWYLHREDFSRPSDPLPMIDIEISQASTFPGFCSAHDD